MQGVGSMINQIDLIKLLCVHKNYNYYYYKKEYQSDEIINSLYLNNQTELSNSISGKIVTNSKEVTKGDIFVCISGYSVDGHQFAKKAEEQGAILIIAEKRVEVNIPQIIVFNSRIATALSAKLYYQNPTSRFTLIGITGTNGKTTTSTLIMNMLLLFNKKVGMIGTLGYYINGKQYESERTTPDILDLNRIFNQMVEAEVEYVVMEVSSHAIALNRVYGLEFDIGCFTNLTQDHLDFHKTMKDYEDTKFKLFRMIEDYKGVSIINIDDRTGRKYFNQISTKRIGITQRKSIDHRYINEAIYHVQDVKQTIKESKFILKKNLNGLVNNIELTTNLSGRYNIYNFVTALAVIDQIFPNLTIKEYVNISMKAKSVKGRLESVRNTHDIGVFIDYAHTPDALENVLQNLNEFKRNRIITVFGAGGDRDKEKRPLMGKIAIAYSDLVIVTNDNPRTEKPENIIKEIVEPLSYEDSFIIISDRKSAIESAIKLAQPDDIILIAGKGHESYQEIEGIKYHFDDYEEAELALSQKKKTEQDIDKLAIAFDILNLEKILSIKIDHDNLQSIKKITTDSRKADQNTLFIGIQGERFDGGHFAESVLTEPSNWVIINKSNNFNHSHAFQVEDSLVSLSLIAKKYLSIFNLKKIAITGSTGKTTTKEYIKNVLSEKYQVLSNVGNENNRIGVPQTILRANPNHEVAVIEMGTNQFGEIDSLARMITPDISIITNIGPSHLEYLGDEEGVLREKIQLFNHTTQEIIYPDQDKRFNSYFLAESLKRNTFGYTDSADFQIKITTRTESGMEFSLNNQKYTIPEDISFKVTNASISIICGLFLKLTKEEIQNGLNKPLDSINRMQIEHKEERTYLLDCYNANPFSMKYAIEYWHSLNQDQDHYCILGDMLELGDRSLEYHEQIGRQLEELSIKSDHIITIGKLSKNYGGSIHFEKVEDLIESNIIKQIAQKSVILIKASHGIHLEKIFKKE